MPQFAPISDFFLFLAYLVAQAAPTLPVSGVGWIERGVYLAGIVGLAINQFTGIFKAKTEEIHKTDTATIASLKALNASLNDELTQYKTKLAEKTAGHSYLESELKSAKLELTALALIEIGKLLNFAAQKRELEAALDENANLRETIAAKEMEITRLSRKGLR